MSVSTSTPFTSASIELAVLVEAEPGTLSAPSTTWALVTIVPSLSTTKPEPVAVPCCGSAERRAAIRAHALGLDEDDARVPPACRCRGRVRPAGARGGGGRLRRSASGAPPVVVSPVSITSVAIRIAPTTRTIRPPSDTGEEVGRAGCFVGHVSEVLERRDLRLSINVYGRGAPGGIATRPRSLSNRPPAA